jgi:hypothetical protein
MGRGSILSSIGKAMGGQAKASAYIANSTNKNATKLMSKAYDAVSSSSGRRVSSAYNDVMDTATNMRLKQMGRNRLIAGGSIATGISVQGSNKKSYYNPMPAPRGTGRYA